MINIGCLRRNLQSENNKEVQKLVINYEAYPKGRKNLKFYNSTL